MKLLIVVGTRPNFVKITQFRKEASAFPSMDIKIVHTGQHNDPNMSEVFFKQFDLKPDFFLNIGPGSPNSQMANIMIGLEKVFLQYQPTIVMVVGDVNSTLAAALCANKCGFKLAHLESGLRSNDYGMPEEINRILTDKITDYFFVTEDSGITNLKKEGLNGEILMVGNTMIDTMVAFESEIDRNDVKQRLGLGKDEKFCLMTIHRPSNVDTREGLVKLVHLIEKISGLCKVVFPIHPRSFKNLEHFGLLDKIKSNHQLICCEPMDYFAFQRLIKDAFFVLTDSGGIQEETTFRQIPCITLRENTERPVTVTMGTNTLAPFDDVIIMDLISAIHKGAYKKGKIPPMWDGKATQRILKIISKLT